VITLALSITFKMYTTVSVILKHWVPVGIVKRIDFTESFLFFPILVSEFLFISYFLATVFPIFLFSERHL